MTGGKVSHGAGQLGRRVEFADRDRGTRRDLVAVRAGAGDGIGGGDGGRDNLAAAGGDRANAVVDGHRGYAGHIPGQRGRAALEDGGGIGADGGRGWIAG